MSFKSFLHSLSGKKTGTSESAEAWKEKRRSGRINVETERALMVHVLIPGAGESATTSIGTVGSVSLRGCSVRFPELNLLPALQIGQVYTASLMIEGFAIPLSVQVARIGASEEEVGLQFKPPYPRELERLEKFLEPRFLGASLREIDAAALQQNEKKDFRWFQGVNETSLFSWSDPGSSSIVHQQLVFLNRVVEWSGAADAKTGRVRGEPQSERNKGWVRAELLDFDQAADAGVLDSARIIVTAAQIDDSVKKIFLSKIPNKD